jgi:hypothetical protein
MFVSDRFIGAPDMIEPESFNCSGKICLLFSGGAVEN